MKREKSSWSNLLMILCGLILAFYSCKEDGEDVDAEEEDATLSVSASVFEFDASGGTESIEITSNILWAFDYDHDLWSRPNVQTAKGDATIQITADANETAESRQMSLQLTADDLDPITITISQEASEVEEEEEEPELADYIDPDNTDMREMTSLELAQEMGLGWNLGNSMESVLSNSDGSLYGNETSWGNPTITQQLIDSVKAAGFNTIRIPVAWSHQFDDEETYDISYEWKLRVEEVVNYALTNDMYVMINIHWDGGWLDQPYYDDQEELNERLATMWQQIAVYFRDYDDHLLFAGTNEVHVENDYSTPSTENVDVQNSFNQTFVNTVRATGGRNSYRHLVIQTFNTNIAYGVDYLTFPEDEIDDRLMVEVHFYDPYQFALEESETTYLWGEDYAGNAAHSGWGDEDWVDESFSDAKAAFVDQGYAVIMGEYGDILKTDLSDEAYELHVASRSYYLNYITAKALENNIVPVYWDNGNTGNYGFGLFNRSDGSKANPDALEAIISAKQ